MLLRIGRPMRQYATRCAGMTMEWRNRVVPIRVRRSVVPVAVERTVVRAVVGVAARDQDAAHIRGISAYFSSGGSGRSKIKGYGQDTMRRRLRPPPHPHHQGDFRTGETA